MVTILPTTPQHWQLKSTNAAVQNKFTAVWHQKVVIFYTAAYDVLVLVSFMHSNSLRNNNGKKYENHSYKYVALL